MSNLQPVIVSGQNYFPIEAIASYSIKTEKCAIKPQVLAWLKRNLPPKDIIKTKIKIDGNKLRQKYCISSEAIKILGVYQAHIESGGDFRARWSELPDSPSFYRQAKIEISWSNIYKWSVAEHFYNTRLDKNAVAKMRNEFLLYRDRFGSEPDCSYEEAKSRLGVK